jgi:hypothetical protein
MILWVVPAHGGVFGNRMPLTRRPKASAAGVFEGGIIVAALFGLVATAVPAETVKLVTRDDLDRPVIGWPVSSEQAIGEGPDRIQFFQDLAVICPAAGCGGGRVSRRRAVAGLTRRRPSALGPPGARRAAARMSVGSGKLARRAARSRAVLPSPPSRCPAGKARRGFLRRAVMASPAVASARFPDLGAREDDVTMGTALRFP